VPKPRTIAVRSTRRRWTGSDARAAIDALDASGLAVATFAQREGLNAQRLYRWRRRLRSAACVAGPTTAFVEIRPQAVAPVEIVLRSARVLRVAESIDGHALLRLVDLLEQEHGC